MHPGASRRRFGIRLSVAVCAVAATLGGGNGTARASELKSNAPEGPGWRRHTIDDSSLGPDGVRLGDINGDGLPDVATPWEQGGKVVVYLNPGKTAVKEHWRQIVVG